MVPADKSNTKEEDSQMEKKDTNKQEMAKDVAITPEIIEEFGINTDPNSEKEIALPIRWRYMFPKSMIEEVKSHPEKLDRLYFRYSDWTGTYEGSYYYTPEDAREQGKKAVNHRDGRIHQGDPRCMISLDLPDEKLVSRIKPEDITCTCKEGARGKRCIHKAMLLYAMEHSAGGLLVSRELPSLARKRVGRIRLPKKRERERQRHEKLGSREVPALDFFRTGRRFRGIFSTTCAVP